MTTLPYNAKNAVTQMLERVPGDPAYIRKVLGRENHENTPPEWRASTDPRHWNYWRREYELYLSDFSELVAGTGIRLPNLYQHHAREDRLELHLEDVSGKTGHDLDLRDCARVCGAWGRAQGRLQPLLAAEWTSRNFISAYARSKPADYALLTDEDVWRQPLIAENWPSELREGLVGLYRQQDALLAILRAAPQVASHLDFWPNNVFLTATQEVVLIDWTMFGQGAACEDVGNFIPDAIFDGFFPAEQFAELEEVLFSAYLQGLEQHVQFDLAEAQRWLWASAVKYVWLGPLLLSRAGQDEQRAYGDVPLADANAQYRHRGITLLRLCEWAQKALVR